jgi:hypothetical protein
LVGTSDAKTGPALSNMLVMLTLACLLSDTDYVAVSGLIDLCWFMIHVSYFFVAVLVRVVLSLIVVAG